MKNLENRILGTITKQENMKERSRWAQLNKALRVSMRSS